MANNEDVVVEELECPICTDFLTVPIRQCATGHSICEKCLERLEQCALCQSPFTESRNYTLEALAAKVKYPCINKDAGCSIRLLYTERDEHERNCMFQTFQVDCQMYGCSFIGDPAALKYHWKAKKTSSRIFGAANRCSAKIKAESYFVNLVEAFNEMFWFKSRISNNLLFFAMQFIGKPEDAHKFFYQIEIYHETLLKKKIMLSDYCKSIALTNQELFKGDSCSVVFIPTLSQFIIADELNRKLNYGIKVFRATGQTRQKRTRTNFNNQSHLQNNVIQSLGRNDNYMMVNDRQELIADHEENDECCIIL